MYKIGVRDWLLVTRLLEVTHGQWLYRYRNMHMHDALTGDIAMRKKEDIWWELLDQMKLGGKGLEDEISIYWTSI
jgi:hypothetical protein